MTDKFLVFLACMYVPQENSNRLGTTTNDSRRPSPAPAHSFSSTFRTYITFGFNPTIATYDESSLMPRVRRSRVWSRAGP